MSKDLSKKAVDMLLKGASLLSEPCPYCKGVRVMKEGSALCVNCGKTDKPRRIEQNEKPENKLPSKTLQILEKKLDLLSDEFEKEQDYEKQAIILNSINSLLGTIEKLKKQQ